jgi:hypothetical protein
MAHLVHQSPHSLNSSVAWGGNSFSSHPRILYQKIMTQSIYILKIRGSLLVMFITKLIAVFRKLLMIKEECPA